MNCIIRTAIKRRIFAGTACSADIEILAYLKLIEDLKGEKNDKEENLEKD
ncbi:MAG: hypothetical protein FWE31_02445 [Firmicutes bacterium]|nr:hypothetical protein [Bacillota bacterium]